MSAKRLKVAEFDTQIGQAYKHPDIALACSLDGVGYGTGQEIYSDPDKGIFVVGQDSIVLDGPGVLEAKVTKTMPEDTPHLARGPIQLQGQMLVTGHKWGAVCVLYQGIELRVFLFGPHYDTPHGTTTKGTPLDRDGRVEKMLEEAVSTLCDVISDMSTKATTEVVLVPGNHDAVMTVALRQILSAEFRGHPNVTINTTNTTRKYVTHGRCLIGLTHGDKAQKHLGELMALEARQHWGETLLREVHHGHRHSEAAVTTVGGVTIRQHPALCPPLVG